jgi:hypothetical protein
VNALPILPPISREAHARLVAAAVEAEREACAKVADSVAAAHVGGGKWAAKTIARAIRERTSG